MHASPVSREHGLVSGPYDASFHRSQTSERTGPAISPGSPVPAHSVRANGVSQREGRYHLAVKVSTRGDYASRALLSLALHTDELGPTSVTDIADRTGLPQPYLEQILLALKGRSGSLEAWRWRRLRAGTASV